MLGLSPFPLGPSHNRIGLLVQYKVSANMAHFDNKQPRDLVFREKEWIEGKGTIRGMLTFWLGKLQMLSRVFQVLAA